MKKFKTYMKESNLSKLKSLKQKNTPKEETKNIDRLKKGDEFYIEGEKFTLESDIEIKSHPYAKSSGWYLARVSNEKSDNMYLTADYPKKYFYRLWKGLIRSQVSAEYEPLAKRPTYKTTEIRIF